jgi:cephalosporin hydroxylase
MKEGSEREKFSQETREEILKMGEDRALKAKTLDWITHSAKYKYSYHFQWMGIPIIQFPQDLVALQELIFRIRPQVIVETGVAHGGSVVFYASMLELLGGDGFVIGIDCEIRPHNRAALEAHPLFRRIRLVEGSSTDVATIREVRKLAGERQPILVALDSNHTHEHVLAELGLYSEMVRNGSYLVVFDTIVEDLPADFFPDRPWGKGNNPKTAVWEFLKKNSRFVIDHEMENKLLMTVSPDGFLHCIRDP